MYSPTNGDLEQLIRQYTEEFQKQYNNVQPTVVKPSAPPEPPPSPVASAKDQVDSDLSDIGSLQVRVSTENQAIPIVGAEVLVTREENGRTLLVRSMTTDENGTTELIDLPAKDRALSLSPSETPPYTPYNIRVSADGYFTKYFTSQPIYGGVTAIQNVSMIPLPEASDESTVLNYSSYR